jgi:serine/threonine protein kinase
MAYMAPERLMGEEYSFASDVRQRLALAVRVRMPVCPVSLGCCDLGLHGAACPVCPRGLFGELMGSDPTSDSRMYM